MRFHQSFFLSLHLIGFSVASQALSVDFDAVLAYANRTENKVFRATVKPNWLPDGSSFWYRVQTGAQDHEYVLINASAGSRNTAKSLKDLGMPEGEARKTSSAKIDVRPTRKTGVESGLKFINRLDYDVELFWVNPEGERQRYGGIRANDEREQHTYEGHVWLVASRSGELLAVVEAAATAQTWIIDGKGCSPAEHEAPEKEPETQRSPDGRWEVSLNKDVLLMKDKQSGKSEVINTGLGGTQRLRGKPQWSPDSSAFVMSSASSVPIRRISMVESSPRGQVQPLLKQIDYAKPGDPLPKPSPVLIKVEKDGVQLKAIPSELFPEPFTLSEHVDVTWSPDSKEFYFDYNQRGHQLYRIIGVDKDTSKPRAVVEETARTFIDYTQKTWRHWLHQSGHLLWMSERNGWCHLYRYDIKSGRVVNAVTQGEWVVRKVLHVDESAEEIWFEASGLRPGEDPYHLHLCRVKFDGSGFRQLTEGDGNHRIEFSPKRDFFTCTWSRADHPPVHELRRSRDGQLVTVLEKADISTLLVQGWTMPERFIAKGRDGKTDIHGIIVKPSHFDPEKKYPVIEDIYAGPHGAFAPKEFDRQLRIHQMAELGFIVVRLDGMGTNHRGKVFHDVCWKNLKDAGFEDRKLWIKEAAKSRPWMDLDRVGIHGGSAGGQNAMRALLDHHDFYKVAVADCGCHDNRMDKIWWNEQWMGWPIDDSYVRSSNVEDAHKLQGQLLLIVGELDTNVDPASTMQVVAALQKAGKTFEFMPMANTGHGAAETPYGSRLRMSFLVRHLRP